MISSGSITPNTYQLWGQVMGNMHRLTKLYAPSPGIVPRPQWDHETVHTLVVDGAVHDLSAQYLELQGAIAWLRSLDQSKESFGLIHCDLHYGNFFVHNNRMTVFDFDDSCYHWFAYDVAVPLFLLQFSFARENMPFDDSEFLTNFFRGYQQENSLEQTWHDSITPFLRYRAILLHYWCRLQIARNALSGNTIDWCQECANWTETVIIGSPFFR